MFGEDLGAELRANSRRCVETGEPISYEEEAPVERGARFWQTVLTQIITVGDARRGDFEAGYCRSTWYGLSSPGGADSW